MKRKSIVSGETDYGVSNPQCFVESIASVTWSLVDSGV